VMLDAVGIEPCPLHFGAGTRIILLIDRVV
jgi:hypothetical protein